MTTRPYSWSTIKWVVHRAVRDIDTLELKHNVVGVTKALRALKIPGRCHDHHGENVVPLIPELARGGKGHPYDRKNDGECLDRKTSRGCGEGNRS